MSQQKATYLVLDLDENDILPFSIHGIFFSDFSCLDAKTSSFWRFRFGKSHHLLNHLHILFSQRNMTFSFLITETSSDTVYPCNFSPHLKFNPYLPTFCAYLHIHMSQILKLTWIWNCEKNLSRGLKLRGYSKYMHLEMYTHL